MNIDKELYFIFKDKYGGKWNPKFLEDVRRLKAGEPTDYIIGWTPFLDCKIDLRYRPLIPRTETEHWAEFAVTRIKNNESRIKQLKILDAFAGSGCVGIAMLKHVKNAKVDFAEIDKKLLKQIRLNLKINRISSKKYRVIYSNVLKNIRMKYDYILANPPYIATNNIKQVAKNVLKYEPRRALFGGRDGLNIIKEFLKDAQRCLKPNGQIWMEFDPRQKKKIEKLIPSQGYSRFTFHKDQYKRWRYLVISAGAPTLH